MLSPQEFLRCLETSSRLKSADWKDFQPKESDSGASCKKKDPFSEAKLPFAASNRLEMRHKDPPRFLTCVQVEVFEARGPGLMDS